MVDLDKIREALADPDAPWYGSDLVPQVASLIDEVDGFRESMKFVMDQCDDEVHCTCTPFLHKKIKELEEHIEYLDGIIDMQDGEIESLFDQLEI